MRYKVIYTFPSTQNKCPDGAWPYGSLIAVNGTFYGTTYAGGANNNGTVFSLTPNGNAEVLFSFANLGYEGGGPVAGVVALNGKLYGTTPDGGISGGGMIFSVDIASKTETVLYNFGNTLADGKKPLAALTVANNKLYGTTTEGGAHLVGTVFTINPATGKERVLYSFGGKAYDGQAPQAALIVINDKLYGTTTAGGTSGQGTVFSVNIKTGDEHVLHSFNGPPDGQDPQAALTAVNGTLYGTTVEGGANGDYDAGTVFSIDTAGKSERVIHSFGSGNDGQQPYAPVAAFSGKLFGTTSRGGVYGSGCQYYCGTAYSIDLASGRERVIHSFGANYDGAYPLAGLLVFNGRLYGTTALGGVQGGCIYGSVSIGTVFRLTPP